MGSCFALNFADSNQERGYYVMNDNGDNLKFFPNTHSIKFRRLYNSDIFKNYCFDYNDYIELYIDQDKLSIDDYQQQIKKYNENYKNVTVVPRTTTVVDEIKYDFKDYNIDNICRESIPENLIPKFNEIVLKLGEEV